jgi:hypothetical protein
MGAEALLESPSATVQGVAGRAKMRLTLCRRQGTSRLVRPLHGERSESALYSSVDFRKRVRIFPIGESATA